MNLSTEAWRQDRARVVGGRVRGQAGEMQSPEKEVSGRGLPGKGANSEPGHRDATRGATKGRNKLSWKAGLWQRNVP